MKKYVKPELFYEHFELNTHIANCGIEWTTSTDRHQCTAVYDEDFWGDMNWAGALFSNDACTGGEPEDYCYQNGADAMHSTFDS